MPNNIGINSSDVCVNIDCGNKLTSFEMNRQSKYSIKYFFCIKCRNRGIPKFGAYTRANCVRCQDMKIISSLADSLICVKCLAHKRKNGGRVIRV